MKTCQGKAVEVRFSSTLGMMLRSSKTDSGCQDLVSSTVSHTPTPPAMGLSPPQTQGTGQGSLEGLMGFKEGGMYANSQSPIVPLAPGTEQAPEVSWKPVKRNLYLISHQTPHQLLPLLQTLHCQWRYTDVRKCDCTQVFCVKDCA